MPACTLCQRPVALKDPYCVSCGHERFAESLQTPANWPPWFEKALRRATVIVGLWLLLTVGIAFLREAKALRWAREALAAQNPARAYSWVSPFVRTHPNHPEALYLAGQATIRLASESATNSQPPEVKARYSAEAVAYYSRLTGITKDKGALERAHRLEGIYRKQIPWIASHLQCGQSDYAEFYGNFEVLGEAFRDVLLQGGAAIARKCVVSGNPRMANEPGFWLIHEKNLDPESVVTALYLEPLPPALEARQYQLAQELALQGLSLWPEAGPQVEASFMEIRGQVTRTIREVREVCSRLARDSEFQQGNSSCFPAASPAAVSDLLDAWGNPVTYVPLSPNRESPCHRGFVLTSLGADARATPRDVSNPDAEITCRYEWGNWQFSNPDRFWWWTL